MVTTMAGISHFFRRPLEKIVGACTIFICCVGNIGSVVADVSTSKLQVHIPQSLSKKDGYDHRDALFGIPPYGGSIQEKVYYANDTLCGPNVDTTKGYPEELDDDQKRKPWKSPFILMVDRGDCTFTQKVRNAQRAGAAAVIIADNTCICGKNDCVINDPQEKCETQEPIMADDGSGADISIPSFLLFKQDADKIKAVLISNKTVRVEMSFSVPAPDSRVEYDLWTVPGDVFSRSFLNSFKDAAIALGKDAFFTPHMFIYDGELAGCHDDDTGGDYCGDLCTNEGRYCATDPDGDFNSGLSGADVVKESLRRICIWNLYGAKDGIGELWWNYVAGVNNCESTQLVDDCVKNAMKEVGINKGKVDQCIKDSGGLEGDVQNELLEATILDRESSGALLIPSLFVNKAPIRGELGFGTAFKAICAGYATGFEPEICKTCSNCLDEEACVREGSCKNGADGAGSLIVTSGVSSITFLVTLLGVTMIFAVVGYIMYQRQQRQMRNEIMGIMAEYMPVDPNRKIDTAVSDEDREEFTIT